MYIFKWLVGIFFYFHLFSTLSSSTRVCDLRHAACINQVYALHSNVDSKNHLMVTITVQLRSVWTSVRMCINSESHQYKNNIYFNSLQANEFKRKAHFIKCELSDIISLHSWHSTYFYWWGPNVTHVESFKFCPNMSTCAYRQQTQNK